MILIKIQPVIPWLALNWVLGVTQCSATHFFIGTLIGMTPLTLTAIYVGMNMHNISQIIEGKRSPSALEIVLFVITSSAFFIIMFLITRESKKQLAAILQENE